MKIFGKKGMELEVLGWTLLTVVLLVIAIGAVVLFTSRGGSYIERIKSLFGFG